MVQEQPFAQGSNDAHDACIDTASKQAGAKPNTQVCAIEIVSTTLNSNENVIM